jgi:hypothetical protein
VFPDVIDTVDGIEGIEGIDPSDEAATEDLFSIPLDAQRWHGIEPSKSNGECGSL